MLEFVQHLDQQDSGMDDREVSNAYLSSSESKLTNFLWFAAKKEPVSIHNRNAGKMQLSSYPSIKKYLRTFLI